MMNDTLMLSPVHYCGIRGTQGTLVLVNGQRLPMTARARQHFATGYEWGYAGSGPAALAHALLAYEVGGLLADAHYQPFKAAVVEHWDRDTLGTAWRLTGADIRAWLADQGLSDAAPDVVRVTRAQVQATQQAVQALIAALDEVLNQEAVPGDIDLDALIDTMVAAQVATMLLLRDAGLNGEGPAC